MIRAHCYVQKTETGSLDNEMIQNPIYRFVIEFIKWCIACLPCRIGPFAVNNPTRNMDKLKPKIKLDKPAEITFIFILNFV